MDGFVLWNCVLAVMYMFIHCVYMTRIWCNRNNICIIITIVSAFAPIVDFGVLMTSKLGTNEIV
jgi:hypothetical protein